MYAETSNIVNAGEIIAITIIIVICAAAGIIAILYFRHKNILISKAIKAGYDPVLVKYAFKETTPLEDYLIMRDKGMGKDAPFDPKED